MFQIVRELSGRPLRGGATERGGARCPGFAALGPQGPIPANVDDLGRQSGFLAHGLADGCKESLAHLGIAGLDVQTAAFQHADRSVSTVDGTVANAGALDSAA